VRLLGSGAYRTEVGALHAGTTFARNPISAADWPRSAVRSVRGRSGARGRREAQIAAVEPTQIEQLLIGDWKRRWARRLLQPSQSTGSGTRPAV